MRVTPAILFLVAFAVNLAAGSSAKRDPMLNREAMRILTIEFPGYKRPADYKEVNQKNYFNRQVELYASAIEQIFLKEYFVEEDGPANANVATTLK
jgi:hypothetical protein